MDEATPVKLCECGCGQPTRIANRTYGAYGWVKGQPKRFVEGHKLTRPHPSYRQAHEYVNRHNPKTGTCEECGQAKRTYYALIHGRTYSRSRQDYRELCYDCHMRYDHDGRRSPRARLTEADVREIRRRWAAGEPQAPLGREYGVAQTSISAIVRRVAWGHVEEVVHDA